ncbi:DUF4007 family protein [Oceanisphaera sp. W20_SRM_FM3]|uniref:DUF4007 family protein n=1 Tax=Oceanisphaera sp. W20_SRM_FM3 TaxID=3240267 RepID=UPI003F979F5A
MTIESSNLKFSGHQTFPVRYGWINKIIQEVRECRSISSKDNIEQQMISMGMGKNMVLSVRHWVRMLGLVTCTDKKEQSYALTTLAVKLFIGDRTEEPYDEYLDKIGTVWLLHWILQSNTSELTTGCWFFNFFNSIRCSKTQLAKDIKLSLVHHDKSLTDSTLNKDIDCFLQSYSSKITSQKKINEDSFASPFTELGLITQIDSKQYLSELATRKSLPIEIFTYAVIDFIKKKYESSSNDITTFSFNSLLNDTNSPGRVFRLSANGLSEKLDDLEEFTEGKLAWTDTQGLRQLQDNFEDIKNIEPIDYLKEYYQR